VNQNTEMIKCLLSYKPTPILDGPIWSYTFLMAAVCFDNTENIKLILNYSSDINYINNYGWTALCLAAEANKINNVKLLLEYGATNYGKIMILHPRRPYTIGDTAVDMAKKQGYTDIVSLLENNNLTKPMSKKENCIIQ
jgi:ankyrin repeat protein